MNYYSSYMVYSDLQDSSRFRKSGTQNATDKSSKASNAQIDIEVYKVVRDPSIADRKSYRITEVTCWDLKDGKPLKIKLHIPRFFDSEGVEYTQKTIYPGYDMKGVFPYNCTSTYMQYVLKDYIKIWETSALSNDKFRKKHHFQHLSGNHSLFDIMWIFAVRSKSLDYYDSQNYYPGNCLILRPFKLWNRPIMTFVSAYDSEKKESMLVDIVIGDDSIKSGTEIACKINPNLPIQLYVISDLDLIDALRTQRPNVIIALNPAIPYYLMYQLATNYWAQFTLLKAMENHYNNVPLCSIGGLKTLSSFLLSILVFGQSSSIFPIRKNLDIKRLEDIIEDLYYSIQAIIDTPEYKSWLSVPNEQYVIDQSMEVSFIKTLYETLKDKGQYSTNRIKLALLCKRELLTVKCNLDEASYFIYGKKKSFDNNWFIPILNFPVPSEYNDIDVKAVLSGFTILHDTFTNCEYDEHTFEFLNLDHEKALKGILWYFDETIPDNRLAAEKILDTALTIHRESLQIKYIIVEYFNSRHTFSLPEAKDNYGTYLMLRVVYSNQSLYISNNGTQIARSFDTIKAKASMLAGFTGQKYIEEFLDNYLSIVWAINTTLRPYRRKKKKAEIIEDYFLDLDDAEVPKKTDYYRTIIRFVNGYEVISYSPLSRNRSDGWVPYGQIEWNYIFHYLWQICNL